MVREYEELEMELIRFGSDDVIVTSIVCDEVGPICTGNGQE